MKWDHNPNEQFVISKTLQCHSHALGLSIEVCECFGRHFQTSASADSILQALENLEKKEGSQYVLKVPVTFKDHAQGPLEAPLFLAEYGDYESPHCGRMYPIIKRVQGHFGNQFRFVFRNFPMDGIYPHAEGGAEAADFAGAQEKFWEMHDLLFENQNRLSGHLYSELARCVLHMKAA